MYHVALRKESVDRNDDMSGATGRILRSLSARRAWIEIAIVSIVISCIMSLSARRAWIEIKSGLQPLIACQSRLHYVDFSGVALRKESVDRNPVAVGSLITLGGSLSARRAWIEIRQLTHHLSTYRRRSPQGERG